MPELPTDEDLRRWENLTVRFVTDQPIGIAATGQGLAVAELARAVEPLLGLIRMERRDAAEHAEERDRLIRESDGLRAKVARIERLAARVADDDPGLADLLLSTLRGES